MRAAWLPLLLLAGCATGADPCRAVTCPDGVACEPATGECLPPPAVLPSLDDLDLGAATRALPDSPDGVAVVSLDREAARLVALRLAVDGSTREARVVAGAAASEGFDAALGADGRLYVLAADADGAGLTLGTPFEPSRAAVHVAVAPALRVRGAVSLAAGDDHLEAAFADQAGDLYTLRFEPGAAAPAPTRVALEADGDAPAVLAEPQVRTFGAGRSVLFFVDEAARAVRVAGRETGAWLASTLLDDARLDEGASYAAGILPDGTLAALAVDGAGRLVLAGWAAAGRVLLVVDDGVGDEALRSRVGAWPTLVRTPDGRVVLGAFDVTAAAYRAWTLDAEGTIDPFASVAGTWLAPRLVATAERALLVGGQLVQVGALWARRLALVPLDPGW